MYIGYRKLFVVTETLVGLLDHAFCGESLDEFKPAKLKGLVPGGGGALNFFFGGCVPHGFPKVGSRERIFLEK